MAKYFPRFLIGQNVTVTKNVNDTSIPFEDGETVKVTEIMDGDKDDGTHFELYRVISPDGVWFIVDNSYLTKGN